MGFYPMYFQGIREDIRNKENYIYVLEKKYAEKQQELAKARANTKLLENMKEKKLTEFKKEVEKKLNEELEEMNTIRRQYMKVNV